MASSTQVETVSTGVEKMRLAAAVVLLAAGLAGFYLLASQGAWVQWGALTAGLVLALAVFFTAETGRQLMAYGRDSWREVRKVVWPSSKEAIQTTLFVFAFAVTMAIFLWLADKTLEWALYDLILGWKGR
jgi:preprotein translocase subunit SecE